MNNYHLEDDLRKNSLNLVNRLRSIKHDAQFVEFVATKFPSLPVVPNERAGCWYVSPQLARGGSVYFKSTDGHFRKWDISMKRLNLHILPILHQHKGIVIVDVTKKGKKFPDALSKTIPIWIAIMNSIVHGEKARDDIRFKSVPSIVSNSEAQQINNQLSSLISKFRNFNVDVENMIYPFLRDLKPLRPIFIHPASTMFSNCPEMKSLWDENDVANLDFTPVILVSASFAIHSDESPLFPIVNSFQYVQGAADDSELWSPGLKQEHYWKMFDQIGDCSSESFLKELVAQQITDENLEDHKSIGNFDWIIDGRLAIGSRKAADPHYVWNDFDVIVNCGAPKFEYDIHREKQVFYLEIYEGKKGQKQLFESFQPFLNWIFEAVKDKKRILIHCMQGRDRSVAMTICLLLRFPNLDPNAIVNKLTKIDVLNTLLFIQRKRPKASPSRSYMNKIHLFFIN